MSKRSIIILLIIFLFCASCTPLLRVNVISERLLKTEQVEDREITASPTFINIRPSIKSLRISAYPSIDQRLLLSSEDSSKNALISETFELWTSEIERLLVANGFKVVSTSPQDAKNRAIDSIEKLANVDATIQINSLKFIPSVSPEQSVVTKFEYFNADKLGRITGPAKLTEAQREYIENKIQTMPEKLIVNYYTAEINLKIIQDSSGEVIWFYRAAAYSPHEKNSSINSESSYFLFIYNTMSGEMDPYQPYEHKKQKFDDVAPAEKSSRISGVSNNQKLIDAAKYKLIRLLCEDFIRNFVNKK